MCTLRLALIFLAFSARAGDCTLSGTVRIAGKNQPVAGAIVYLGNLNGRVSANTNVTVEVVDGELRPHVQIASRSGHLLLRNLDATLHVLKVQRLTATNALAVWSQAMPYAGFEKLFALDIFREPTLIRIVGGNGEGMSAYIAVMPHPWAVFTDEHGQFEMRNVPSTAPQIFAWHEILGTAKRDVRLSQGHTNAIELVFSRRDERRHSD